MSDDRPDLVLRQLQICSEALGRIEHDRREPMAERPWAVAAKALAGCRQMWTEATGEGGTEVVPSRYTLEDVRKTQ